MSKPNMAAASTSCACGTETAYSDCCGRWHQCSDGAPTAELLMRSRYSAYVLMLEPYLLATWHVSTRPVSLALEAEKEQTHWLGLKVLRSEQQSATQAIVEFIARYRVGGASAVRLHEVSRFVREDGRWYYLDGECPPAAKKR